jgi:glycosyltransferase involved in cell wall biosynthesis
VLRTSRPELWHSACRIGTGPCARGAQLMSNARGARLRVALFHGLPPGGALRALYEVVKRFPPDLQVDLFTADLAPVDRFTDLAAGTYHLDLSGSVASTRSYELPGAVRALAPRLGRIGAFVVGGEGMRRVQRQMARDINHDGYDVAYVHACRFSLSVPIAEWLTVPCVFYAQETRRVGFEAQPRRISRQRNRQEFIRLLRRPYESVCRRRDRRAVAAVDRILCNSRFSADMLTAAYGIDPVVCYLGVDDKTFCPSSELQVRPTALAASRLRVLSIGALHPVKGHDLALAATARAANATSTQGELHVVYERERPGYASELDRLARSLRVEFHLHRGIPDEELVRLYHSAQVTVCAARLEPFGLIVLESTSCGTPVVAVAQGGYRETVIDGVNGYLAERNEASLGEAIVRVTRGDLRTTPEALHAMVSRDWSWDAAAERIADQLRLAASEPKSGERRASNAPTRSVTTDFRRAAVLHREEKPQ